MTNPQKKSIIAIIAAIILGYLQGCASIVEGTSQTVTIETDPSGAICHAYREGETIGAVNPTPGTFVIDKDKDNVQVTCQKDGYREHTDELASQFQSMTLGNILIGGVIGVAIDAGTGAMHHYPKSISLTLTPNEFSSITKRDDFYKKLQSDIITATENTINQITESCQEENGCKNKLEEVNNKKEIELAKLETQRKEAKVNAN